MALPSFTSKHLHEGAGLPGYLTWSCQGAYGKIVLHHDSEQTQGKPTRFAEVCLSSKLHNEQDPQDLSNPHTFRGLKTRSVAVTGRILVAGTQVCFVGRKSDIYLVQHVQPVFVLHCELPGNLERRENYLLPETFLLMVHLANTSA